MINNDHLESREEYRKRLERNLRNAHHSVSLRASPSSSSAPAGGRPTPPPVPEKHHHTLKWIAVNLVADRLVLAGGLYEYHKVHQMATGSLVTVMVNQQETPKVNPFPSSP